MGNQALSSLSNDYGAWPVRSTRLSTVGDRAFPIAAACTWNVLPRNVTSTPSLPDLLSRLKTQPFSVNSLDSCNACFVNITYSLAVNWRAECNCIPDLSALAMPWRKMVMNHSSEYWYIGSMLDRSDTQKNRIWVLTATGMYWLRVTSMSRSVCSAICTFDCQSSDVWQWHWVLFHTRGWVAE